MGNFKEQLRRELQQDAPFTEEVRGRIVLRQPLRKRGWYIPAVSSMFIVIIALFIFLMITRQPITPYTVLALPSNVYELVALLKKNEVVLPYIKEETPDQEIIFPDDSYINGYQQRFERLPMIVEKSSTYEIGDYVMLDEHGLMKVAQIVGTAGDTVALEEGSVTVNGQSLALPNMVGEVLSAEELIVEQSAYLGSSLAYTNEQHVTFNKLARDELVVAKSLSLEKWTLNHVKGKVVAIQQITPTYTLTEEEQQLYTQFKESHQLELLRDVSPITIAKLYVTSDLKRDNRMNYALLTNKEEYIAWSLKEHLTHQSIHALLSTLELELLHAYEFSGLERGKFIETEEGYGYIDFTLVYQPKIQRGFQMVRNDEGIWQVAFMPLQ
ncbi:hypothetical protein [Lysinibacillus sp. LZ02]|uniref:hypothetical protein n=1 Tax=Lysinibacillus sp. LZ02 TaxID=3420668 RepID=UPI003D35AB9B